MTFSHHSFLGCSTITTITITNTDLFSNYRSRNSSCGLLRRNTNSVAVLRIATAVNACGRASGGCITPRIAASAARVAFPFGIRGNHGGPVTVGPGDFGIAITDGSNGAIGGCPISLSNRLDSPGLGGNTSTDNAVGISDLSNLRRRNAILLACYPSLRCGRCSLG